MEPQIAVQLRRRGHDVIAIAEPDPAARYAALPDDVVFERAQEDDWALVSDNVADFEPARIAFDLAARSHHGVFYALRHSSTASSAPASSARSCRRSIGCSPSTPPSGRGCLFAPAGV